MSNWRGIRWGIIRRGMVIRLGSLAVLGLALAGCGSERPATGRADVADPADGVADGNGSDRSAMPTPDGAALSPGRNASGDASGGDAATVSAVGGAGPTGVVDLRGVTGDALEAAIREAAATEGLAELILEGAAVDDAAMRPLWDHPTLKRLKTESTRIGDATLAALAAENRLELLYLLDAPGVTGEGIRELRAMTRLRNLRLSGTAVDDDTLAALGGLTNLAALALQETAVTDDGLGTLVGLTELRELSLYGTPITDRGLATLAELPRLAKLRLRRTGVTGADASPLASMSLEELELAETEFDDEGMADVAAIAGLRRLNLWSTRVGDPGVGELAGKASLVWLNLDNLPGVTDRSLDTIATLAGLEFLHLGKTSVTPGAIPRLAPLERLATLHISQLGASEADRRAIRLALSGLENLVDAGQ